VPYGLVTRNGLWIGFLLRGFTHAFFARLRTSLTKRSLPTAPPNMSPNPTRDPRLMSTRDFGATIVAGCVVGLSLHEDAVKNPQLGEQLDYWSHRSDSSEFWYNFWDRYS
jgi:hypothetical protein